jgi:hypothetical protein
VLEDICGIFLMWTSGRVADFEISRLERNIGSPGLICGSS